MGAKLENLRQLQLARLDKGEWTGVFAKAHENAFTSQNIKATFRGTGIHPFLPSKLLRQTPSVTPEPDESVLSTSPPITPFLNSVLTSSPMNIDEVYTANSALSNLIESAESISSDGKEYFNCLVRSSNLKNNATLSSNNAGGVRHQMEKNTTHCVDGYTHC
jgi:hypothetical protein